MRKSVFNISIFNIYFRVMVEAKNFVEKELGRSLDEKESVEAIPETKEVVPIYTPPAPIQEPPPAEPQLPPQPTIQIVEKVIYKKQRIHGFFRTLTIIALVVIGFLMLGESTGIIELSINNFKLHTIYPLIVILSAIILRSYKKIFGKIFWLILFLWIFWGIFGITLYTWLNVSSKQNEWEHIQYTVNDTTKTNIQMETLIGNSYIEGNKKNTYIEGIRNSDRMLILDSWANEEIHYLNLNEDKNRNVLQNYRSDINLTLPNTKPFNLIYIKNFLWLHTIDLNTIQRTTLKIHGGINDITINTKNILSGNKIEIQATAANIEISIPKDVGVRMYYKHKIGRLNIPGFTELTGHYFESDNIKNSKKILHIYIQLLAGNTKIIRTK